MTRSTWFPFRRFFYLIMAVGMLANSLGAKAGDTSRTARRSADEVKLKLPQGFKAVTIAESVGRNRHIDVNANGDIYVKLTRLKNGKGIVVLREKTGSGKAQEVNSFGNFVGTGIALKNGYVYASNNSEIFRYKLNAKNEVDPSQKPERIVTGLLDQGQHNAKSIALDDAGNIYVNIGAPSNSCQIKDRENGSLGQDPCPLLEKAGGIWKFKSDRIDQSYEQGTRYATGIRNAVGLTWNTELNDLFAVQHGRDGLHQMFGEMYTAEEGAELPSEEMLRVTNGANFGWPYCYYDHFQNKKILAPEYGGDKNKTGRCEGVKEPEMAFPGHWGPNAILFYTGDQFPAKYKNGAFIAFHGSWNRAPLMQKGYKVVFVPYSGGKPAGEWEEFAEGFMGAEEISSPGDAKTRPCGLAQGPDGSLYISDSVKGTIWKIVYNK